MSETKGVISFDGHLYEPGEELPDLGSFVAKSVDGNTRNYEGLESDFPKLEQVTTTSDKYKDLETGSSAFLFDAAVVMKYEAKSRKWYKVGG